MCGFLRFDHMALLRSPSRTFLRHLLLFLFRFSASLLFFLVLHFFLSLHNLLKISLHKLSINQLKWVAWGPEVLWLVKASKLKRKEVQNARGKNNFPLFPPPSFTFIMFLLHLSLFSAFLRSYLFFFRQFFFSISCFSFFYQFSHKLYLHRIFVGKPGPIGNLEHAHTRSDATEQAREQSISKTKCIFIKYKCTRPWKIHENRLVKAPPMTSWEYNKYFSPLFGRASYLKTYKDVLLFFKGLAQLRTRENLRTRLYLAILVLELQTSLNTESVKFMMLHMSKVVLMSIFLKPFHWLLVWGKHVHVYKLSVIWLLFYLLHDVCGQESEEQVSTLSKFRKANVLKQDPPPRPIKTSSPW